MEIYINTILSRNIQNFSALKGTFHSFCDKTSQFYLFIIVRNERFSRRLGGTLGTHILFVKMIKHTFQFFFVHNNLYYKVTGQNINILD